MMPTPDTAITILQNVTPIVKTWMTEAAVAESEAFVEDMMESPTIRPRIPTTRNITSIPMKAVGFSKPTN